MRRSCTCRWTATPACAAPASGMAFDSALPDSHPVFITLESASLVLVHYSGALVLNNSGLLCRPGLLQTVTGLAWAQRRSLCGAGDAFGEVAFYTEIAQVALPCHVVTITLQLASDSPPGECACAEVHAVALLLVTSRLCGMPEERARASSAPPSV